MKKFSVGGLTILASIGLTSVAMANDPAILSDREMDMIVAGQASIDAPLDGEAADVMHGSPGNTPGFGGASANPKGGGVDGGDGIHNIDSNWGIADDGDTDRDPGSQGGPADEMHMGLDTWTGQFGG